MLPQWSGQPDIISEAAAVTFCLLRLLQQTGRSISASFQAASTQQKRAVVEPAWGILAKLAERFTGLGSRV